VLRMRITVTLFRVMQCSMDALDSLFKKIRCLFKGHRFVASRTEADVEVCVRCRLRRKQAGGHAGQALATLERDPPNGP